MHPDLQQILHSCFFIILVIFVISASAKMVDFAGQISGSAYGNKMSAKATTIGVRYIPGVSIQQNIVDNFSIDTEFLLNMYSMHNLDFSESASKVKPYRFWARFATSQFQVRIGLQKINFGSAMLLRPLMWFDRIDPRDPLQITDGVYALLLRYYFLNNANIWLWGVYGQDQTKGLEVFATKEHSGEFGGRMQVPLMNGEIAASYHHRDIEPTTMIYNKPRFRSENRYALDGKWDLGVGVWFEAVLIHQNVDLVKFRYRKLMNLGMDYTFAVGNGLHALSEFFLYDVSGKVMDFVETMKISALMMDYNLGLFDQILTLVYFDWKSHDFYRFATWRRTLDKWSFNLSLFWNPEKNSIYNMYSNNLNSEFSGKGIQLMAIFNY